MQSGKEGRHIRRQEKVVVECFKCREKGHKHREYPKRREESIRRVKEEYNSASCMRKSTAKEVKEKSSICFITKSAGAL